MNYLSQNFQTSIQTLSVSFVKSLLIAVVLGFSAPTKATPPACFDNLGPAVNRSVAQLAATNQGLVPPASLIPPGALYEGDDPSTKVFKKHNDRIADGWIFQFGHNSCNSPCNVFPNGTTGISSGVASWAVLGNTLISCQKLLNDNKGCSQFVYIRNLKDNGPHEALCDIHSQTSPGNS